MTINKLRSIEKGRRNIDGYKNKSIYEDTKI